MEGSCGLPWWLSMKESAYSIGDPSLIPGPEDPLEEGMATHSSTLAGKPHEQRSREGYSPWGHKESNTTAHTEASWNNPAVTGTRAVLETYFLHVPPLRLDSSHS